MLFNHGPAVVGYDPEVVGDQPNEAARPQLADQTPLSGIQREMMARMRSDDPQERIVMGRMYSHELSSRTGTIRIKNASILLQAGMIVQWPARFAHALPPPYSRGRVAQGVLRQ